MSKIVITRSAIDRLINDPKLRRWRDGQPDSVVPVLRYFHRSYATSHDGIITEHGDGFTLTIDPANAEETGGIVIRSVAVAEGLQIRVGSDEMMMSGSFMIGWRKWKFTYELLASS